MSNIIPSNSKSALISESTKTIYEKLMQLQLIREIEELSSAKEDEYEKVLQKWQQQDVANSNEFQYIEPILTQRTVMYQINDTLANNINIKNTLFNTYLEISKIAADKENLPIATRSLGIQRINIQIRRAFNLRIHILFIPTYSSLKLS